MDSTTLRELQAPLKEQYRSDPGSALIVLRAEGSLDAQNIACKIETGRTIAMAGLHPATGGNLLQGRRAALEFQVIRE